MNGSTEEDIFFSGKPRVEPNSQLNHSSYCRRHRQVDLPTGRRINTSDDSKHCALARAIFSAETKSLPRKYVETHVPGCPQGLPLLAISLMDDPDEFRFQRVCLIMPYREQLQYVDNFDITQQSLNLLGKPELR